MTHTQSRKAIWAQKIHCDDHFFQVHIHPNSTQRSLIITMNVWLTYLLRKATICFCLPFQTSSILVFGFNCNKWKQGRLVQRIYRWEKNLTQKILCKVENDSIKDVIIWLIKFFLLLDRIARAISSVSQATIPWLTNFALDDVKNYLFKKR